MTQPYWLGSRAVAPLQDPRVRTAQAFARGTATGLRQRLDPTCSARSGDATKRPTGHVGAAAGHFAAVQLPSFQLRLFASDRHLASQDSSQEDECPTGWHDRETLAFREDLAILDLFWLGSPSHRTSPLPAVARQWSGLEPHDDSLRPG